MAALLLQISKLPSVLYPRQMYCQSQNLLGTLVRYWTLHRFHYAPEYMSQYATFVKIAMPACIGVQGLLFNEMRSKTKVIPNPVKSGNASDFPAWSFDGSSTGQAEGNNSDCILL